MFYFVSFSFYYFCWLFFYLTFLFFLSAFLSCHLILPSTSFYLFSCFIFFYFCFKPYKKLTMKLYLVLIFISTESIRCIAGVYQMLIGMHLQRLSLLKITIIIGVYSMHFRNLPNALQVPSMCMCRRLIGFDL